MLPSGKEMCVASRQMRPLRVLKKTPNIPLDSDLSQLGPLGDVDAGRDWSHCMISSNPDQTFALFGVFWLVGHLGCVALFVVSRITRKKWELTLTNFQTFISSSSSLLLKNRSHRVVFDLERKKNSGNRTGQTLSL